MGYRFTEHPPLAVASEHNTVSRDEVEGTVVHMLPNQPILPFIINYYGAKNESIRGKTMHGTPASPRKRRRKQRPAPLQLGNRILNHE